MKKGYIFWTEIRDFPSFFLETSDLTTMYMYMYVHVHVLYMYMYMSLPDLRSAGNPPLSVRKNLADFHFYRSPPLLDRLQYFLCFEQVLV